MSVLEEGSARRRYNRYIASAILTASILMILIFSGTVEALRLIITPASTSYSTGDSLVSFITEVDIEILEKIPLQNLTLKITGPSNESCTFSPGGAMLAGCTNITSIVVLSALGFGYGNGSIYNSRTGGYYGYAYDYVTSSTYLFSYGEFYGYGYLSGYGYDNSNGSELRYNITWNLTKAGAGYGSYNATLEALVSGGGVTHTFTSLTPARFNYTCTESWSYSTWSDCTNGRQTRTATDLNDCGTTNNLEVISRSCSGTGGGGGGGGGGAAPLVSKSTDAEKQIQEERTGIGSGARMVIPAGEEKPQEKTAEMPAAEIPEKKVPLSGGIILLAFAVLIAILLLLLSRRKKNKPKQP